MKKLKVWKQMMAFVCTAAIGLSLVGCGSDKVGNNQSNVSGHRNEKTDDTYVYVPEFISLNLEEGTYLGEAQIVGDVLYYDSYEWEEATGKGITYICRYDMNTGETLKNALVMDVGEDKDAYMNRCAVDENGCFYSVWNVSPVWEEGKEYNQNDLKYYLVKYDHEGKQVYMQDITEIMLEDEMNSYIQSIIVDTEGKVYASSENVIRIFGEDGTFRGNVEINDSWIMDMSISKEGRVFFSQYSNHGNGITLTEVLADTLSLGETFENIPSDGNSIVRTGAKEDLIISASNNLYAYSLAEQTCTEILSWAGCNIMGSNVRNLKAMEDGTYRVICEDYSTDTTEIVKLTKKLRSEVPAKTTLVLGTFNSGGQDVQRAVVNFNKNNPEYVIEIEEYQIDYQENWTPDDYENAVAQFNASLVGEHAPDIIDISYNIDVGSLLSKDALEDLAPYLESSDTISREDFVEGVIRAHTINEKLITIPKTVRLSTLLARTAVVGDEPGWTIQDVINLAEENPDAELMDYVTKSQMLNIIMMYSHDVFVDAEKGTCHFNNQEFKDVLEFVNRFPEEYKYDENRPSLPKRVQSGELLLVDAMLSDTQEYQMYSQMFEAPITNIGFPTFDGSQGTYMQGQEMYAIFSNSKNKDGAWQFIESILQYRKPERWGRNGFSSRTDELDEMFENDMTPEYILDENGEKMLNENGEPMQNPKTSWGYEDWDTDIYAATQEQVDELKAILNTAKSVLLVDETLYNMIEEEAQSYFAGQKSVDEVADIIQSRASIYVSANY